MSNEQTNGLAAFDPNALKERIAKHIQGSFGTLIPEEAFKEMCDKAVKEFFENPNLISVRKTSKHTNSGYGGYVDCFDLETKVTPFQLLVHETVHSILKEQLKKHLDAELGALKDAIAQQVKAGMDAQGNKSLKDDIQAILLTASDTQMRALLSMYAASAHSNLMAAFQRIGAHEAANYLSREGIRPGF